MEPFSGKHMSATVLKRLLTQKNLGQRLSFEEYKRKNLTIYSVGSLANFFCLVLEGCVQVVIGKDALKFESRSFSYFGAQAMINARESPPTDYKPDFTARPLTDCLLVVVSQSQYMAARRASMFEEGRNGSFSTPGGSGSGGPRFGDSLTTTPGGKGDVFSTEWAKADTQNLETTPRTTPSYPPIDMYVAKHSEVSKEPVGVRNFSVMAPGRKPSPPPSSSQRRLSDQRHLLEEESSSDPGSPTNVRILVDRGGGGGGEGRPSVMLTSPEEHRFSPSRSSTSSNDDYKSSQV